MRKFLKYSAWAILIVLVLSNVLILVTGNTHLYKGIRYTYLVGKKGPGIDDLEKFPFRVIPRSPVKSSYQEFENIRATEAEIKLLKSEQTVAFVVMQEGVILKEWYDEGFDQESVVNSFSMSKSIIGLLIGSAIQNGYIGSVNDPARKYLPEGNEGIDESVTIKSLLQMSSGINFDENYTSPFAFPAKGYYGNDLRKLISSYESEISPSQNWKYKGGDTQVLAFILEEATGMKVSEYLHAELWNKLGCQSDAFWSLDKTGGDEKASCCLYATARDLLRVGGLILDNGKIQGQDVIAPSFMKEMFEDVGFPDGDGRIVDYYGYQWWKGNIDGTEIRYARGILGQYVIVVPEKQAVIVRYGRARSEEKIDGVHPSDVLTYLSFID